MLSRPPASQACRLSSRELLQALVQNSTQPVSRQLLRRGTASLVTPRTRPAVTQKRFSPVAISDPKTNTTSSGTAKWQIGKRYASTAAADKKDQVYELIDKINEKEGELAELLDELNLIDDHHGILNLEGPELDDVFSQTIGHRSEQVLEDRVRMARQEFGDTLPDDLLNDRELELYTRLYGEPVMESELLEEELEDEKEPDRLYRESVDGNLEEVEFEQIETEDDIPVVYDMEAPPAEEETLVMTRAREIAEQLGGEVMLEQFAQEAVPDPTPRLHPATEAGKFSTDPSTVFLPKDTVTTPISVILSNFSNKHISEVAHRTFGGQRLPHSTTTAPARAQLPQLPIPLDASQNHMSEMEANAYIAALYPGVYATTLSILVEVRKRLGSDWIRRLITQEGGPRVLDAGGGGAGILAWREVLRAEYELMVPDHPKEEPIPLGKTTVVTGSDSLRARASIMLENTTFLPRLPDYVHVRDVPTLDDQRPPPKRKQYDIIIAPHTLLGIDEDYMRKEQVENLWSLLNPDGGVLVLFEKGRQRGFEAIAGARDMLLERHISSPGSREYENLTQSPDEERYVKKETGMIIAPCTNHQKCPMYLVPGQAKGRRDYCRFEQRYIRPNFLQRIIGAKDRNHEDVEFSYIAVQRGVDLRETHNIVQGPEATDAAFAGFEHLQDEAEPVEKLESVKASSGSATQGEIPFNPLNLPRTVFPPMKRRGHVIFDFCTPAGKIERWTVPRSFSRQAYRDARKAHWGDLWALGAKTRIPRNLNLGDRSGEGKKERLERRAAARAAMREEGDDDGLAAFMDGQSEEEVVLPTRKKGQTIPSWKKHADKKKVRQAFKQQSSKRLGTQTDV
ncbi:37S ribosomal protein S22 [Paecilomyces lecythidis]|uniref:37S ribosomal protein S22 n=1 Tax=Paecilomyces lecythidis TaxID=3004212 RepID=A0ABR3YCT1_9EURO